MKKLLIIISVSFIIGIICGTWLERTAAWHDKQEWMQISQEACDLRIKTLKATCKK